MLAAMAIILKSALEAGLILALFLIGLSKAGLVKEKTGVYFSVIGAAAVSVVLVYGINFFGDREVFEGYLALAVAVIACGFGFWIWRRLRSIEANEVDISKKRQISVCISAAIAAGIMILSKTVEIIIYPGTVFVMSSNLLNSEIVLKIAGGFLGLIIAAVFVLILIRTESRISNRDFVFFSFAVLLVVIFRQLIVGIQVLFATGVLPLTTWAVSIIAPLINSYYPIFFYSLVGITAILWSLLIRRVRQGHPDTAALSNPAQKRKLLARFNTEQRWVKAFGFCIFSVIIVLGSNMAFANPGVKIEPPTPVSAQGDKILIPLEQVNDGKLHRFSYMTPQNSETRFIVIKKGENLYGTGFDACDICGEAGYYQRGNDVICKNCDVVINIPTIGFPGGCNPIPIKNKNDGKNLVFNTVDLEAKQDVFRD